MSEMQALVLLATKTTNKLSMWILEENNRNVKWNNPLSLIFPLWPWKVMADHSIRWPVASNLSILHSYINTRILRAPPAVSSKQLQVCQESCQTTPLEINKAALIWEQNPIKQNISVFSCFKFMCAGTSH